jgi:hypothetical protein
MDFIKEFNVEIILGFLGKGVGTALAIVVGVILKYIYDKWQRSKYDARFDRDIAEFIYAVKKGVLLEPAEIKNLMKLVVPLVSKVHYGTDIPPLKKGHPENVPANTPFDCKVCEQHVDSDINGRCKDCKLDCRSWHNEFNILTKKSS